LILQPEAIVAALLQLNIYNGLCLGKALTVTQLSSSEMFKVLLIIEINKSIVIKALRHLPLLGDMIPYRLARGILLK